MLDPDLKLEVWGTAGDPEHFNIDGLRRNVSDGRNARLFPVKSR
jgi:hypothetical protein